MAVQAAKILAEFLQRMQTITRANGFYTDAGQHVFDSRTYFDWLDKSEFPALSIFWPEENVESNNEINKLI